MVEEGSCRPTLRPTVALRILRLSNGSANCSERDLHDEASSVNLAPSRTQARLAMVEIATPRRRESPKAPDVKAHPPRTPLGFRRTASTAAASISTRNHGLWKVVCYLKGVRGS